MESKIIHRSSIWDLHIHTNKCPKASGDFKSFSTEGFIDFISNKINETEKLEMISFTDHNIINFDIYKSLAEKKHKDNFNFLVGVEVDVLINESVKHIIVYFDIDKTNLIEHIPIIEDINKRISGNKTHISLAELLNFLISINIKFVLSPHAFKQNNRGIDFDWNDQDTVKESKQFMDQFFCFWESSGHSSIGKAEEFISSFYNEEKISIISFSDSNEQKKFNDYIANPPVYFNALPNFRGLQMVASDSSRIVKKPKEITADRNGNLIGKVTFKGNSILFSDGLNTIIGGRGSGKSLLLDKIAQNLGAKINNVDRNKFLSSMEMEVRNFSNNVIESSNFKFDYFEQSYVSKLFDSGEFQKKIKSYFKEEFDSLEEINSIDIETLYKSDFKELYKKENESTYTNISNLIGKMKKSKDLYFPRQKKGGTKINKLIEYTTTKKKLDGILKNIPKELQKNENILKKIKELKALVMDEQYSYNENSIKQNLSINAIDAINKFNNSRSENEKNKAEVTENIKSNFSDKSFDTVNRVNLINCYLKMSSKMELKKKSEKYVHGENENAFLVSMILEIENPMHYFMKKCESYFLKGSWDANTEIERLAKHIENYCYTKDSEKKLKDGKNIKDLDDELESFELNYNEYPLIRYYQNDEYNNIEHLSPGTQTNILMEYLVHKKTVVPLLIDQPEDNVDNQTIYNVLRKWFKSMKEKRQVIVVTHDANIVINSDAENVIIATHNTKDAFNYTFGALEWANNLEVSSNILDGGKDAVKRRLIKYGE